MRSIRFIAENAVLYRNIIEALLLAVLVGIALVNDIKNYKIPNKLNFGFLIIGLVFNVLTGSLKASVIGLLLPFVLFPLFALRMMGAGDIKLFCAIGAIVGFPHVVSIVAYSIVFNGVVAIVLMVTRKHAGGFKNFAQWLRLVFTLGKVVQYQTPKKNIFRYAYGIVLGCCYYIVTTLILGGQYALL